MVAYTETQQLPYQVGTDRPCDMPDVWCDLAELVDTKFYGYDQTLGRVTPAVPAAKLTRSTPFISPLSFGAPVEFESVEFDTDDMTDLSRSAWNILPRRLGVYLVVAVAEVVGGGTAGFSSQFKLGKDAFEVDSGGTSSTYLTAAVDNIRQPGAGNTIYHRTQALHVWNGTDVNVIGYSVLVLPADAAVVITKVSLAAYWVRDVVG